MTDISRLLIGEYSDDSPAIVFTSAATSLLIAAVLAGDQCFKGLLPSARRNAVVCASEIGFGNLQIEYRLTLRLILGVNNLAGFVFIAGVKAASFAGFIVHAIKHSTSATTVS